MTHVKTIAVSLEPEYVEAIDRLAKRFGSRSEALRELLREHQHRQAEAEWRKAYEEYFAVPGALAAERDLTREMLSIARWPQDEAPKGKGPHDKRKRS